MSEAPKLYIDVEAKLGEPLGALIAQRRNENVAWRRIANEITARTGIDITGETLRLWHQGRPAIASPAA